MRRSWKGLVAVGAVTLFATFLFLLPRRDDGLDWIRKYGAVERTSHPGTVVNYDSFGAEILSEAPDIRTSYLQHDFVFVQIPKGVVEQAIAMQGSPGSDLWLSRIDEQSKTITFQREVHANWFQRQWTAVMRKLGFS